MRGILLGFGVLLLVAGCAGEDNNKEIDQRLNRLEQIQTDQRLKDLEQLHPTATPTTVPMPAEERERHIATLTAQTALVVAERELNEVKASMKEFLRHKGLTDVPSMYEPTNRMTQYPGPAPLSLWPIRNTTETPAYYGKGTTRYLYTYQDGEVIQHELARE